MKHILIVLIIQTVYASEEANDEEIRAVALASIDEKRFIDNIESKIQGAKKFCPTFISQKGFQFDWKLNWIGAKFAYDAKDNRQTDVEKLKKNLKSILNLELDSSNPPNRFIPTPANPFIAVSFQTQSSNTLVIAFPGTDPSKPDDIIRDVQSGSSVPFEFDPRFYVGSGFLKRFLDGKTVLETMKNTVLGHLEKDKENQVCITGHSLGGALATLFLHYLHGKISNSRDFERIRLITFAGPRVYNLLQSKDAIPEDIWSQTYRIIGDKDTVTALPFMRYGSRHVGNIVFSIFNVPRLGKDGDDGTTGIGIPVWPSDWKKLVQRHSLDESYSWSSQMNRKPVINRPCNDDGINDEVKALLLYKGYKLDAFSEKPLWKEALKDIIEKISQNEELVAFVTPDDSMLSSADDSMILTEDDDIDDEWTFVQSASISAIDITDYIDNIQSVKKQFCPILIRKNEFEFDWKLNWIGGQFAYDAKTYQDHDQDVEKLRQNLDSMLGLKLSGNTWNRYIPLQKTEFIAVSFLADASNTLVFAFPGTNDMMDVIRDIKSATSSAFKYDPEFYVGHGFAERLLQGADRLVQMKNAVKEHLDKNKENLVSVTGHSLGGAVGVLFFHYLYKNLNVEDFKRIKLITFASPRVYDLDKSKSIPDVIWSQTYRIINDKDYITAIPLMSSGFRHVGNIVFSITNIPRLGKNGDDGTTGVADWPSTMKDRHSYQGSYKWTSQKDKKPVVNRPCKNSDINDSIKALLLYKGFKVDPISSKKSECRTELNELIKSAIKGDEELVRFVTPDTSRNLRSEMYYFPEDDYNIVPKRFYL